MPEIPKDADAGEIKLNQCIQVYNSSTPELGVIRSE